ncbi:hypothetical protein B0J11DRAFT_449068 [Dendryphion nanum]|uniref:Uncharacterized protein n=1 Tax=Dendryphion nanum TaxID=256645 RepID=A0A9P9CZ53_9PLEO|nr:hypothetical protein B0J11DRAFT_449068 [Dendryphion nanum]
MCLSKWRPAKDIGWVPLALRRPMLLVFGFLDLALICSLAALSSLSKRHNGFVTVGTQNLTSFGISWNLGLLWTTLPVLVFRLLGLYWEWITSPVSQRQPFVDLLRHGGASARKTILLDYLSVPILWRWCTAFKNRHFLVGFCSLLTLVMSVIVSALSARLFAVGTVAAGTEIPVIFNTSFDASAINSTLDWVPILDTVSAIKLYNGIPLPWTDQQYAFQSYFVRSSVAANAEITARTKAYSAYLNCSVLSDYKLDSKDSRLYMTANDRGCDIAQDFLVSEMQQVYFKTTSEISCSTTAWYSRMVFTAAKYSKDSPTSVSNMTVLSCITSYRTTIGDLTTTMPNGRASSPVIKAFHPLSLDNTRPSLWRVFEQNILSPTTLNPDTVWSTSAFGTLALYAAQQIGGREYLSPIILQRVVSDIFSASYLTAAALHAFVPQSPATETSGRVIQLTQRLFTVYWVTYLIIVVLVLNLCTVFVTIIHVYRNATILEEEPAGLLAYAAVLDRSPLMNIAAELRSYGRKSVVETAKASNWKKSRWAGARRDDRSGWVIIGQ